VWAVWNSDVDWDGNLEAVKLKTDESHFGEPWRRPILVADEVYRCFLGMENLR
jgi:hypothetical protein